jgi:hypothetical protein
MAFDLPLLPQFEPTWPQMQVWWQQVVEALKEQETAQDELIQALADAVAAIQAAQDAADAANAAAAAADAAATAAQQTANEITAASELGSSYVSGLTITATDAGIDVTISISAHTRHYPQPDGSVADVAVNGGSLLGRAYSTVYYIYYDDPARAGGAVSYQSTTTEATAAQVGDRHTVGAVTTPAALAAPTGGSVTRPPGVGTLSSQ